MPIIRDDARIILILPCCIGDVVLATATLAALRRAYPAAHITWAVGAWSRPALLGHPLLDALLDTGPGALPLRTPGESLRFVRALRRGRYDLAVSLVRSPRMSLALLASGIPIRAGLDSAGRGFGYTVRARIDPDAVRHEAEIYLDVPRALGLDVSDCWATVPPSPAAQAEAEAFCARLDLNEPFAMLHPGGGRNPGMTLDAKRWPPENVAALADRLVVERGLRILLVGGPGDEPLIEAAAAAMRTPALRGVGQLSMLGLAALAARAHVYIGNDTGLTHLAAAAGAKTVMILGPSDPRRYAPFTPDSLALWKPTALAARGVAAGAPAEWDWARDGIQAEEAAARLLAWLGA